MTFCYADPPYIGYANYYPENEEVCHRTLVARLCDEFPDGWALSLHSPSLKEVLSYCPDDVRVGAWVKPFCSFKPSVRVAYAWEPVIIRGGRKRTREQDTIRDWIAANITLQRGLVGAKPHDFCVWVFEMLGMQAADSLIDMFPGSGAVTRSWEAFRFNLQCRERAPELVLEMEE